MDLRNKFTEELVSTAPAKPCEEVEKFFKTMRQAWDTSELCKAAEVDSCIDEDASRH